MKERARLIIPLWGAVYARKLVTMTLPALLARGNLPVLCDHFDVELVIVTETNLFETIEAAQSYRLVSSLCKTRLVPIDDLMTDVPGDYGVVLTHALYRGFVDLGQRMTDTFLLFFNADFIVSDGSLGHLAQLMKEGKRVIHAPSFRVVLEDVWPKLESRIDAKTGCLNMSSREMVKLALANKHLTVKARTVNQRLCHQWRMDQFYWYVDDTTFIGYQWPVALVAIKPEVVTLEPSIVWDYGFVPDAAPTAQRHFIDDSDDFFMIEPQSRVTGADLVRIGWISEDEIAADLSKWTTKEQRECGRQLLKIHATDMPNVEAAVQESREYMAGIYKRLNPEPLRPLDHALLGPWFAGAKLRMRGRVVETAGSASTNGTPMLEPAPATPVSTLWKVLGRGYRALFGSIPNVGKFHPLWTDLHDVATVVSQWQADSKTKLLWLGPHNSFFHGLLSDRVDLLAYLLPEQGSLAASNDRYDHCFCELTVEQFAQFRELYDQIRPSVKDGGIILVYVFNNSNRVFQRSDVALCESAFPDLDWSEIHFKGSRLNGWLSSLFLTATSSFPAHPWIARLVAGLVSIALAPFARLANGLAASRDHTAMLTPWTSLTLTFTVRKAIKPIR
jgi:hypothetical protein